VWNRMRTAAKLPLALSEETLTECSLYKIALAHQGTDIVIELQTKRAEGNHGADWEWWLVHNGTWSRPPGRHDTDSAWYTS
jgi:hypothetical protein